MENEIPFDAYNLQKGVARRFCTLGLIASPYIEYTINKTGLSEVFAWAGGGMRIKIKRIYYISLEARDLAFQKHFDFRLRFE